MNNNEPIYLKLEDTAYDSEVVQLQEKIVNQLRDCFSQAHAVTTKGEEGRVFYSFTGSISENGVSILFMLNRHNCSIKISFDIETNTELKEDEKSFGGYTPWWFRFGNERKCNIHIKSYREFIACTKWCINALKELEISTPSAQKLITTLEKIYQEENV